MPTSLSEYANRFENVSLERDDGILQVTLHSAGDSVRWSGAVVDQLQEAFAAIGADRENRVVILTGSGASFTGPVAGPEDRPRGDPASWEVSHWRVRRMLTNFLEIEVPVISAINGPAVRHCELPLLADVVLASQTVYFQDSSHFRNGLAPGDGIHVVLPFLMGRTRASYFMLTGQELPAAEAREMGLVNEVLAADKVLPRARELAGEMARRSFLVLRYSKVALTHVLRQTLVANGGYGVLLEAMTAIDGGWRDS
jgi:enoyl-CoA hydratase/carnithine racemase